MVGQSVITYRGLMALIDATQRNRQIKVHSYKASTMDITLDPNISVLPNVWKSGNISGYIPVNQNTVEFIIDIPQEEATNYSRTFGLYLEDGTLFMLAKPPYPFPPYLRQVMKVQLVFQNATELINFQYIPFYETEQDLSILDTTMVLASEILELYTKDTMIEEKIKALQVAIPETAEKLNREIDNAIEAISSAELETTLDILNSKALHGALLLQVQEKLEDLDKKINSLLRR